MPEGAGGVNRLWSEIDLARRLCNALDVAKNAIDRLAPAGFEDPDEPANDVRPEKVISESALLLLAASTAAHHTEVNDRLRELSAILAHHARSERIMLGICAEPALAFDYAMAHVCLTRLGHADGRFDAALVQIGQSQARNGRERPPHRALEQAWIARGLRTHRDESGRTTAAPTVAQETVLAQSMDLLNGSRDDVYAFTHSLMYVTDFNIRPWRLPRKRLAILADAEAALARCLDDQDYDLAGEVLLAWPLIGARWSASAAFGFRVLAHVEDQAGFLPSTATKLDRYRALPDDRRSDYLVATAYHTAYVMGLVCAAALQPGRAPPAVIRGGRAARGVADTLLAKLDASGPRPHWREEFDELTEGTRDRLAGTLLTIGLRRCAVQRDFSGLRELLQIGQDAGLTGMPAASQAAEMLARLAYLA
jgi:hypothetical protein